MDADQLTPELAKDAPRHSMQRLVVHLDLFSGIGGFALAAQMVGGIKTAAFCEIDPWARQVLAKNFPGVPIHDDVKTLNPNDYGTIDLITGGYPCQPFSVAGLRRGEEDYRHLWPVMRGIIADARPRMVLCENVAGRLRKSNQMKTYLHKDGRIIREDELKELTMPKVGDRLMFKGDNFFRIGQNAGEIVEIVGTKPITIKDDRGAIGYISLEEFASAFEPAPLTLEVGKRYVMRNGEITSALVNNPWEGYPFAEVSKSNMTWTRLGNYWAGGSESEYDLIREAAPEECGEVAAPDYAARAKEQLQSLILPSMAYADGVSSPLISLFIDNLIQAAKQP